MVENGILSLSVKDFLIGDKKIISEKICRLNGSRFFRITFQLTQLLRDPLLFYRKQNSVQKKLPKSFGSFYYLFRFALDFALACARLAPGLDLGLFLLWGPPKLIFLFLSFFS